MTSFRRTRRSLLKGLASGAAAAAYLASPIRSRAAAADGELWGGFLILSEGIDHPIANGNAGKRVAAPEGGGPLEVREFDQLRAAAKAVKIPLYGVDLSALPSLTLSGVWTKSDLTGKPFIATAAYSRAHSAGDTRSEMVLISAEPAVDLPVRMFPVRSARDSSKRGYVKLSCFPSQAIQAEAGVGAVVHWIEGTTRYTLEYREPHTEQQLRELAAALVRITA